MLAPYEFDSHRRHQIFLYIGGCDEQRDDEKCIYDSCFFCNHLLFNDKTTKEERKGCKDDERHLTAMSCFDFMEGDKYVIYHKSKEDIDKHAHELSGKESPVKFIDPAGFGGGAVEIISALSDKAIVAMMGDRTFGSLNNKVEVCFLGAKTEVPYGIYKIAAALGTPVVIIFFPRAGAGKVDSVIAGSFFVSDKGQKAENYLNEVQKFIKSLENFCGKYPYQFFNFYDI